MKSVNVELARANPTWPLYLNTFLEDLDSQNLSPKTAEVYGNAVTQLAAFLVDRGEGDTEPATVAPDQIRAFMSHLLDNRSSATANNRYRALNRFFNWLLEQEYIDAHPMARLKPPRIEERVVDVVNNDDLTRLFKAVSGRDFESRRDKALFSLMLDSGLRLSELANIRVSTEPERNDLDLQYNQIRVFGKGKRERLIGFGGKTKSDLGHYLIAREAFQKERARRGNDPLEWLWLGKRGHLTHDGIYQMVKRRGREAGIPDLHPHRFRHSFANAWLAAGGNENDLLRLAGWRSRAMLSRYGASAGTERALAAQRQLSARDRI